MTKYDWVVFFIFGIILVAGMACLLWIAYFLQPVIITSVDDMYWSAVVCIVGLVSIEVVFLLLGEDE